VNRVRVWTGICLMRRSPVALSFGLFLVSLPFAHPAAAQGYGLYEHNACTMARGGTGVADPCADGSAIFFNPAGLSLARGRSVVSVGGTFVAPRGDFTDSSTGQVSRLLNRVIPSPSGYYARGITERATVGLGVFAPYGLETDWPDTSEGRFLGYKSMVRGLYVQPTVAYRLGERWSVGAGIDVNFVSVELRRRLDLAAQAVPGGGGATFGVLGIPSGTDFADVALKGSARGWGYHVGIRFQATDRLALGARFLSRQRVDIGNGRATIAQIPTGIVLPQNNPFGAPAGTPLDAILAQQFAEGAPLSDQTVTTVLNFPEQAVVGFSYEVSPGVKVLGDANYTDWRVFQSLPIDFQRLGTVTVAEDYRATYGGRFGGEVRLRPGTTLRAGFDFHGAAAPAQSVTPVLPGGARREFSAGVGTRPTSHITVDLAYEYVDQSNRLGRSTNGGMATPTVAVDNGVYAFHAHLFGVSLSYAF